MAHMIITFSQYLFLESTIISSNHEIVGVKELKQIQDIKGWLTPVINTPEKHSNPHNFLFRKNVDGKAEMYYRNWSADPWLPENPKPGLVLLQSILRTKQEEKL